MTPATPLREITKEQDSSVLWRVMNDAQERNPPLTNC